MINRLNANHRRALGRTPWVVGGGVLLLWTATLLASNVSFWVITAFWLIVGFGLALWVQRDIAAAPYVDRVQSALRRDEVEVFDVRAEAFVEFLEVEDEGARFAFALDSGQLLFVEGYRRGAKFPSLDFSIIRVVDEQGTACAEWLEKRGARAKPSRTIDSRLLRTTTWPGHLGVQAGTLDAVA